MTSEHPNLGRLDPEVPVRAMPGGDRPTAGEGGGPAEGAPTPPAVSPTPEAAQAARRLTLEPLVGRYLKRRVQVGEILRNTAYGDGITLMRFAESFGQRPVARLGRSDVGALVRQHRPPRASDPALQAVRGQTFLPVARAGEAGEARPLARHPGATPAAGAAEGARSG